MTEKELKKLGRSELLELLIEQTKRVEELEMQVVALKRQLGDRRIREKEAGSIAEAALQVNGVFEAADAAAKQYLDNIRLCSERCDAMLEETKRRCVEMEKRAREKMRLQSPGETETQTDREAPDAGSEG